MWNLFSCFNDHFTFRDKPGKFALLVGNEENGSSKKYAIKMIKIHMLYVYYIKAHDIAIIRLVNWFLFN